MKDKRYANNPQTITDLKAVISQIRHETIKNVLTDWVPPMGYRQVSRSGHLTETIFDKKCHTQSF